MTVAVHHADMLAHLLAHAEAIARGEAEPFDSCATDPPYHLTAIVRRFGAPDAAPCKEGATGAYARASRGFMGKTWDGGDIAQRPETWRAVFDCLKPGAHLVAFAGTRTYHRMTCAIEEAGFEIRDQLAWAYGSGFPKSHDMSKAIDRHLGVERPIVGVERPIVGVERLSNDIRGGALLDVAHGGDRPAFERDVTVAGSEQAKAWEGWGTALKPAWEPICLARKPIAESSVAANLLAHSTGAVNIGGCRVGFAGETDEAVAKGKNRHADFGSGARDNAVFGADNRDRGANGNYDPPGRWPANLLHDGSKDVVEAFPADGEAGSATRFYYSAKAGPLDRIGTAHATVKPVDLMRWLTRLVTPAGGHVLDPFAGSGTTAIAALAEGFRCTLVEIEADHVADIERKLAFLRGEGKTRVEEHLRRSSAEQAADFGPLFGSAAA